MKIDEKYIGFSFIQINIPSFNLKQEGKGELIFFETLVI